jgi:cytidine deaminase
VSDDLLARAQTAAARAYAPYSEYPVGAAVRTRDGRIYEGVNVENAAYPLSPRRRAAAAASGCTSFESSA